MEVVSVKISIPFKDVEFDINKPFARGGMATVHKGTWAGTDVAVKVVHRHLQASKYHEQLLKEVRLLAGLHHSNIVRLFGVSTDTETPLIVLEYADGGSLYSYLQNHPEAITGPDIVNHLLYQISLGMVYLHSQQPPVIHGDLKAANCLLCNMHSGILLCTVKITDFGLSRIQTDSISSRTVSTVTGTLGWLAPERLDGGKLTQMVDVYAFSMTAYEILTVGKLPFELNGYKDMNLLGAIFRKERPIQPPSRNPPVFVKEHWDLTVKCWNQDPSLRPDFREISRTLKSISSNLWKPEKDESSKFANPENKVPRPQILRYSWAHMDSNPHPEAKKNIESGTVLNGNKNSSVPPIANALRTYINQQRAKEKENIMQRGEVSSPTQTEIPMLNGIASWSLPRDMLPKSPESKRTYGDVPNSRQHQSLSEMYKTPNMRPSPSTPGLYARSTHHGPSGGSARSLVGVKSSEELQHTRSYNGPSGGSVRSLVGVKSNDELRAPNRSLEESNDNLYITFAKVPNIKAKQDGFNEPGSSLTVPKNFGSSDRSRHSIDGASPPPARKFSEAKFSTHFTQDMVSDCAKSAKIIESIADQFNSNIDSIIPYWVLLNAKGLVILNGAQTGVYYSGRAASGIVVSRLENGMWSAPCAIATALIGIVGQVDVNNTNFVIVLTSFEAVRTFSNGGQIIVGGNLIVKPGPIGRNALPPIENPKKKPSYTYLETHGHFAEVLIDGTVIAERKDTNQEFYGQNIFARDILGGVTAFPPTCATLYRALRKLR